MEKARAVEPFRIRSWTFITNHAQVLTGGAPSGGDGGRGGAGSADHERSAYRMLADLQQAGYVRRRKVGRHNSYEIDPKLPLRDPILEHELVGDLIALACKDGWRRDPEQQA
jgi:hypothetical protein